MLPSRRDLETAVYKHLAANGAKTLPRNKNETSRSEGEIVQVRTALLCRSRVTFGSLTEPERLVRLAINISLLTERITMSVPAERNSMSLRGANRFYRLNGSETSIDWLRRSQMFIASNKKAVLAP